MWVRGFSGLSPWGWGPCLGEERSWPRAHPHSVLGKVSLPGFGGEIPFRFVLTLLSCQNYMVSYKSHQERIPTNEKLILQRKMLWYPGMEHNIRVVWDQSKVLSAMLSSFLDCCTQTPNSLCGYLKYPEILFKHIALRTVLLLYRKLLGKWRNLNEILRVRYIVTRRKFCTVLN